MVTLELGVRRQLVSSNVSGSDRESVSQFQRSQRRSGDSDGVGVRSPPCFTVGRSDITVNGQKDLITPEWSNVNDVFVYDTTKDMDGGRWRMDDRAKASSWYNEAWTTAPATRASTTPMTHAAEENFSEKPSSSLPKSLL